MQVIIIQLSYTVAIGIPIFCDTRLWQNNLLDVIIVV